MKMLPLFLLTAALGQAAELTLAPGPDSRLALEVDKTGLMKGKKHSFVFQRFHGKAAYDEQTPANSKVQLTIEAASIELKDAWLSEKDFKKVQEYALQDMLAAEKFPQITFVSTKVTPGAAGQFNVEGTLTIRGISKPVTLSVKAAPDNRFEGSAEVKLTDYGLKPPSAALGTIGTKDAMRLSFTLKAAT